MTRRHRKPKPRRVADSLVMLNVTPTVGVVERIERGTAEARALALAKREIERALIATGIGKRQACRIVSGMTGADLLVEAARVRAAADPVQAPEHSARPWWRRLIGGEP